MIKRFLTVKLQGSRAVVDAPIYLYQNDRDICLAITMVGNKYQYDKETKLSFTLIKPNGDTVDSAMASIINGKYHVVLSRDLFDDEDEVGQFLLQIKQYSGSGVVSLPPFAIHVLKGYSEPLTDDGLLTDEDYLIITENEKTIQIKGTVKISDLPTTQIVDGYLPISQGDETFKLDMSILPTKGYVANEIAKAQLDGSDVSLDGYATTDDLALLQNDLDNHNHDERYALQNHSHQDIMEQTYSMGYSLQQQMTNLATLDHTHSYNDLEDLPTGLATETYVDNAVANITVDASGLATKQELSDGLDTKADAEHDHDDRYYTKDEVFLNYVSKQNFDIHVNNEQSLYASINHNHDNDYASINHNHDFEYAPKLETSNTLQNLKVAIEQEEINRTSVCDGLQNEIDNRALKSHWHDDTYAQKSHQHDEYVYKSDFDIHEAVFEAHGHDNEYSRLNHTHSQYLTSIPSEYITETELDAKGYLTEQDLSNYATKDEIPTLDGLATETYVNEQVATKANVDHTHTELALANHSHNEYALANHEHQEYLTEHQDISHLALKSELTEGLTSKAEVEHTHSYNDLTDKPTIPSIDGLATTEYVDNAVSNVTIDTSSLATKEELSDYALKTEIPTVPTKVSELTNDSGYLTAIPSEYVTETELDAKGYLTEHQDVSGLATRQELTDGLATKSDTSHTHTGMLTSTTITRIELVDALPSEQETGVLYIVKASE